MSNVLKIATKYFHARIQGKALHLCLVPLFVFFASCPAESPGNNPKPPNTPDSSFTVSFYLNDGTQELYQEVKVASGSKVSLPAPPTRDTFQFAGWITDKNTNTVFDTDSIINANSEVYAFWIAPTDIAITLDSNGGFLDGTTLSVPISKQLVAHASSNIFPKPKSPRKNGFVFSGWYTPEDTPMNFSLAPTSNITLVAKYKTITDHLADAKQRYLKWIDNLEFLPDNPETATKEQLDKYFYSNTHFAIRPIVFSESAKEYISDSDVDYVIDTDEPTGERTADRKERSGLAAVLNGLKYLTYTKKLATELSNFIMWDEVKMSDGNYYDTIVDNREVLNLLRTFGYSPTLKVEIDNKRNALFGSVGKKPEPIPSEDETFTSNTPNPFKPSQSSIIFSRYSSGAFGAVYDFYSNPDMDTSFYNGYGFTPWAALLVHEMFHNVGYNHSHNPPKSVYRLISNLGAEIVKDNNNFDTITLNGYVYKVYDVTYAIQVAYEVARDAIKKGLDKYPVFYTSNNLEVAP